MQGLTRSEVTMSAGGGLGPPQGENPLPSGGFGAPPPAGGAPPGGFGTPMPGYPQASYPQQPPQSGPSTMSIASLILGILGMMTTCFPLGILGLWLGARARKAANSRGEHSSSSDNSIAMIGMILGGLFGGLWGLYWIISLVMILLGFGIAFLPFVLD